MAERLQLVHQRVDLISLLKILCLIPCAELGCHPVLTVCHHDTLLQINGVVVPFKESRGSRLVSHPQNFFLSPRLHDYQGGDIKVRYSHGERHHYQSATFTADEQFTQAWIPNFCGLTCFQRCSPWDFTRFWPRSKVTRLRKILMSNDDAIVLWTGSVAKIARQD